MTCTLCGENCWPPCWRSWAGPIGRIPTKPVTSFTSAGLFWNWSDQPRLNNLDITSSVAPVIPTQTQRVREKNSPAALQRKGW